MFVILIYISALCGMLARNVVNDKQINNHTKICMNYALW